MATNTTNIKNNRGETQKSIRNYHERSRSFTKTTKYFILPTNLSAQYALYESKNQHKGIRMVQNSIDAGRACNECIILVFGCSGSGKTESLNHLFGFNVISVGDKNVSDTEKVTEYMAILESDRWEVSNLEIGFIDIPGFHDTDGIERDAENIAILAKFIKTHPHLSSHHYKCYPNAIIITIDSRANRMEGKELNMLKLLKYLNIIDIRRPNIVFVLTHVMSFGKTQFELQTNKLSQYIKKIAKLYLEIEDVPVIRLENKPNDFELAKNGDMTELPNGTLQPKNLFKELIGMMNEHKDDIGLEAIRVFFASRGKRKPLRKMILSRDQVSQLEKQQWSGVVMKSAKAYRQSDVNSELKRYERYHNTIQKESFLPLMNALALANYLKVADILGKNLSEVNERLMLENHNLNIVEVSALIDVFNLKPYKYENLVSFIGTGYHPEREESIKNSIFDYGNELRIRSGVDLPICMDAIHKNDYTVFCEQSKSNPNQFDFTIMQSVVKIFIEMEDNIFSIQFKQDVMNLPNLEDNEENNEHYTNFLDKYGYYVALESIGGGIIQGTLYIPGNMEIGDGTCDSIEKIINMYYSLLDSEKNIFETKVSPKENLQLIELIKDCKIEFIGGIPPIDINSFRQLSKEHYTMWILSLITNPMKIPLSTTPDYMKIMFHIVREIEKGKKAHWINNICMPTSPTAKTSETQNFDKSLFLRNPNKNTINVREDLSDNVETKRLNKGFPESSILIRKKSDETNELVKLKYILEGDRVQCISKAVNDIEYRKITKIVNNHSNNVTYKLIETNDSRLVISEESKVATNQWQSIEVKKLKLFNELCFVNREGINIKSSKIKAIQSLDNKDGNIDVEIESDKHYLIVNGFACDLDQGGCFPRDCMVILKGGDQIPISQLQLGQYVLSVDMKTNKPLYTKVYLWAHRQPHTVATFLRIVYQDGAAITLTHNHLLPTNTTADEHCTRPKMLPASQLKVGDIIYTTSATSSNRCATPVRVLSISTCTQTGYYAPLTNNSVIVVDGVVASVFSLPASPSSSLLAEQGKLTKHLSLHTVAHHLFTPLRIASKLRTRKVLSHLVDKQTGIHKYCNLVYSIYKNFL